MDLSPEAQLGTYLAGAGPSHSKVVLLSQGALGLLKETPGQDGSSEALRYSVQAQNVSDLDIQDL